jgi:hypothetical protein
LAEKGIRDLLSGLPEKLGDAWGGLVDLIRPRWKHSAYRVRLAAVAGLTDQKVLAQLAKHDISPDVQVAATAKLTDEEDLAFIIRREYLMLPSVREAAVKNPNFTNQAALEAIANGDKDEGVRKAAAARLGKQE